ncbi:MAG TPA: fumarylacetoacetate hydrolase family protein, partial [Novosphingobium sp.]
MRLVTYRRTIEAEARLGVIVDDLVIDVARLGARGGAPLPMRMLDFIQLGRVAVRELGHLLAEAGGRWPVNGALPLASVKLLAPIPRPAKNIFGIGLNYIDHVAESAQALDTSPDLPKQPVIFSKPPTTVIAPGEPIVH